MKKALFATTALAVMSFGAAASAVDVELYGQVSKGVMMADDGTKSTFNVVDNEFNSTRLGVKGSQQLDNGLTASVLWEAEMQSNNSEQISTSEADETSGLGAANFVQRHARVGLAGEWGAVFVGNTSTATAKVAEQDLAGASDVSSSDISNIGGGIDFSGTGGTVAAETDNMMGDNRADLVRYDSPIFNGFQGRVSVSQGSDVDAAVFYDGRYDAFAVKAALGYTQNNDTLQTDTLPGDNDVKSTMAGSISVKHDNGIGATLAYGQQELDNAAAGVEEPEFVYGKIGYTWDAFEVAADMASHKDVDVADTDGTEVKYMGLAGQYNLGNGVSAAAYVKQFEYEDNGVEADDVSVYGVNMRVKF